VYAVLMNGLLLQYESFSFMLDVRTIFEGDLQSFFEAEDSAVH